MDGAAAPLNLLDQHRRGRELHAKSGAEQHIHARPVLDRAFLDHGALHPSDRSGQRLEEPLLGGISVHIAIDRASLAEVVVFRVQLAAA